MINSENRVLEKEIADLLSRGNTLIPLQRTTVRIYSHIDGRHSCRIEISGGKENPDTNICFEEFLGEGFFLRAEKSLTLQLKPNRITNNLTSTT